MCMDVDAGQLVCLDESEESLAHALLDFTDPRHTPTIHYATNTTGSEANL
jgi:hypothetical protein